MVLGLSLAMLDALSRGVQDGAEARVCKVGIQELHGAWLRAVAHASGSWKACFEVAWRAATSSKFERDSAGIASCVVRDLDACNGAWLWSSRNLKDSLLVFTTPHVRALFSSFSFGS